MESQLIEITGPGGATYEVGEPMLMFAGGVFLGRIDPVLLSNGGVDVHLGSFTATSLTHEEPRNVGALLFYEACAHLTRFHPQVQQIHFASSRAMPGVGNPATQASARVTAVERIGATNIQLTPTQSGYIVVSGTWVYNEANLHLLDLALQEQRAMYEDLAIGPNDDLGYWFKRLRRALRSAFQRATLSKRRGPRSSGRVDSPGLARE